MNSYSVGLVEFVGWDIPYMSGLRDFYIYNKVSFGFATRRRIPYKSCGKLCPQWRTPRRPPSTSHPSQAIL